MDQAFSANLSYRWTALVHTRVVRRSVNGSPRVRPRYRASVQDALEKLQYELFYVKPMSPAFHLFIVPETVKTVLVGAGS
jgi:lipopolysaccharide/colanic/teichoic acid biosynthesis glycosyltransferase